MLPAEVANQNEQADLKQPLAELFSIHATAQKGERGRGGGGGRIFKEIHVHHVQEQ